jgi:hypothetical protein
MAHLAELTIHHLQAGVEAVGGGGTATHQAHHEQQALQEWMAPSQRFTKQRAEQAMGLVWSQYCTLSKGFPAGGGAALP